MPYLNLDLDFFEHIKIKRLVGLLGRGAEVLPIRLWCYCGKHHTESGKLTGYSTQEIESIIAWWGKDGQAVEALVKVGLLSGQDGTFYVHDWKTTNGHLIAFKKRAKQAASIRWKHATSIANNKVKQSPNHTIPYQTIPTKPNSAGAHVPIPKKLDTEEFREAFKTYVDRARLNVVQQESWLKLLLRFGSAEATVRVLEANAGGWKNIPVEDRKLSGVSGGAKGITPKSTYHCPKCDSTHPLEAACTS